MPWSRGPQKKPGKIVRISAFIARPEPFHPRRSLRKKLLCGSLWLMHFASHRPYLLLLLFCRDRGVDLQHALGTAHAYSLSRESPSLPVRLGSRPITLSYAP